MKIGSAEHEIRL